MRTLRMAVGIVVVCGLCGVVVAAPQVIRYQGRLTNSSGQPITAATEVTLSFYSTETGGSALAGFADTDTVTPNADGIYTTLIGDVSPGQEIPAEIFTGGAVYLNVNVGGEDLSPRLLVTPSAYALDTQTISGYDISRLQVGTQDFVAAEDVHAGDLLALNLDSQVEKMAPPSTVIPFPDTAGQFPATVLVDTNKLVTVYTDGNAWVSARVVTVSGDTFTYGTPIPVEANGETWHISATVLDTNRILVVDGNENGSPSRAVVGTVAGETITFGPATDLNVNGGPMVAVVALAADRAVMLYQDYFTGECTLVAATIDETGAFTFGTPIPFNLSYGLSLLKLDADRCFLTYNDANDGYTKAVVGTVAGTELTLGSPVTYNALGSPPQIAAALVDPEQVLIVYSSGAVATVVATVSGSTVTFGAPQAFLEAVDPTITVVRLAEDRGVVLYANSADGDNLTASPIQIVGTVASCDPAFRLYGLSTYYGVSGVALGPDAIFASFSNGSWASGILARNLTAHSARYIGVAEQTVTAGNSCRVTVGGGITRQFSGLTPGRKYYISPTGIQLFAPTDVDTDFAGRALSTTRFLVQN